ncbi:short-chain dehydrogenase [Mycobacterium sp. 852002-51971_SCH5477799-a]|uniref:SDR family oxidoreductase n=1 Tax=Mycobacterium sp. 852002-51971_SCH5477799-a TaxID=1834106 RepID=UPI0007FD04A9|nr:SDR family oxidoreductase [Mycobacterium sp. 852002-51971_SCH5477799-a]OBF63523.1 short-chain dehydrogenase [Mycobacterium sp. 852002-51971_SCH5477799-a]
MTIGKVVLVTGAGSGIGASTADALARRGARLILVDIDASSLTDVSNRLDADKCVAVRGDVRDFDAMQAAVDTGVGRLGRIDAVVANAGIGSWVSVTAMEPAEFRRVVDVNLTGLFHTVRAAAPALIDSRGYVLVVASVASYVAAPGLAAYCASKAGAEQFAHALRLEVASHGVDVGCAHLSWVDTPLLQRALSESSGFAAMLDALPRPLRRVLSADDCGEKLAAAVDRRATRIAMPGWVGLARWAKPLLSMPPAEHHLRARIARVTESQP